MQRIISIISLTIALCGGFWITDSTFFDTAHAASNAPPMSANCVIVKGEVFCWGYNFWGQVGDGTQGNNRNKAERVILASGAPLTNATAVTNGSDHSCALVKSGSVYCWGANTVGQLGDGTGTNSSKAVLVKSDAATTLTNVVAITAGGIHTCVITKSGLAYCWGGNGDGQLGNNNLAVTASDYPVQVLLDNGLPLTTVSTISAGNYHVCATTKAGLAYCWGDNVLGQLGTHSYDDKDAATQVLDATIGNQPLTNVTGINTKLLHTCATRKTGTVACWGNNSDGQLGDGSTETRNSAVTVEIPNPTDAPLTNIQQVSVGAAFTCATSKSGAIVCWGKNTDGQLGDTTNMDSSTAATQVKLLGGVALTGMRHVSAGLSHACALSKTGVFYCWGDNGNGNLSNGSISDSNYAIQPVFRQSSPLSNIATVDSGESHSCALSKSGTVSCWGNNDFGQLGDGTLVSKTGAVTAQMNGGATLTAMSSMTAGRMHSCTVAKDGNAYCWGANSAGQLGDTTTDQRSQAVPVKLNGGAPFTGVMSISAGNDHTCALTKTGLVYCWGDNTYGQIGNGTNANQYEGAILAGGGALPVVSAVATGTDFTCALTKTGLVYCWGINSAGQLGNDNIGTDATAPAQVLASLGSITPLTNVTAISAGDSHACALTKSKTVYCWGSNISGQLGIRETGSAYGYALVAKLNASDTALANIVAIAAGAGHTCASTSTTSYCWGKNEAGEIGDDSLTLRNGAVIVKRMGGNDLGSIAKFGLGTNYSCGATKTGGVFCWGDNASGQLGDNTHASPVDAQTAVAARLNSPLSITGIK